MNGGLRRGTVGRSSSSSDDATSSSSSSDNLVLNICQEKNLSTVPSSAALDGSCDTKLTTKIKVQLSKDGTATTVSSPAPPALATKKEEKMEVDDDGQELKVRAAPQCR